MSLESDLHLATFTVPRANLTKRQADLLLPPPYAAHSFSQLIPGCKFFPGRGAQNHLAVSAPVRWHATPFVFDRLADIGVNDFDVTYAPWPYSMRANTPLSTRELYGLPFLREGAVRSLTPMPGRSRGDFRPWQIQGLQQAFRVGRYALWHPGGSGKTLSGIAFLIMAYKLWYEGLMPKGFSKVVRPSLLFTTTVGPTYQMLRWFRNFTELEPFVYTARSKRRKRDKPLAEYLVECKEKGQPSTIILGREHMPDVMFGEGDLLGEMTQAGVTPIAAVLDEIHRFKSHKLATYNQDTKLFDSEENQAAALFDLLNKTWGDLPFRLALSASPIGNATSDLWAQFHQLDPWAWGSWYDYAIRYSAGTQGEYGFNARGESHIEEFDARSRYLRHITTKDEVLPYLPPVTIVVERIPVAEQGGGNTSWKASAKSIAKSKDMQSMAFFATQVAAERKRPWVVRRVVEELRAGRKVLVFTGFQTDVVRIYREVLDRMGVKTPALPERTEGTTDPYKSESWLKSQVVPYTKGTTRFFAHFGSARDPKETEEMCNEYNTYNNAAFLVGTGASIGESYNLERTDILIFAQTPPDMISLTQQMARVETRLSRDRPIMMLFPLAEETYDTRLVEILQPKAGVVSRILGDSGALALATEMRGSDASLMAAADRYLRECMEQGTLIADLGDDD